MKYVRDNKVNLKKINHAKKKKIGGVAEDQSQGLVLARQASTLHKCLLKETSDITESNIKILLKS